MLQNIDGAMPPLSRVSGAHEIQIARTATFDPKVQWVIEGSSNTLIIEEGAALNRAKIMIRGRHLTVRIGRNCRFKQGTLSVAGVGSSADIGEFTTWESGQIIAEGGERVTIGRDCMFSHDIMIRTADGHGIFDKNTRELINPPKPVSIGEHVWIGNGARVNKGAVIGRGSVLAHASILSGEAEAESIYAGVPARKLRGDIVWSRTQSIDDVPDFM